MVYQVTARKWRPQTFGEVVGQEHVTTTLQNALASGRIAQSYLFCGPRGVGKTTAARLLAKALNCAGRTGPEAPADPCNECDSCCAIANGTSMNVLEIDGASNNSVDDIRELREVVRYVSTAGTYKIYIIDEVHMLSTAAFNALLKTLEEPPPHVVFIFATTEVQEVPETILSRCQRFNFRRIAAAAIAAHLARITAAEGIAGDEDALFQLATRADGSLRDAESALDQVVAFDQSRVTLPAVQQVLGIVDRALYFQLTEAVATADAAAVLQTVARATAEGTDVEEMAGGFAEHLRHLLHAKIQGDEARLELGTVEIKRYLEAAERFAADDIVRMLQVLMDLEQALRRSAQPRLRLELALVRMAQMGRSLDVGDLLVRLQQLEGALAGAGPPDRGAAPATTGKQPAAASPRSSAPRSKQAVAPPEPPPPEEEPPGRDSPPPAVNEAASAEPPAPGGGLTLEQVRGEWEGLVAELRKTQPTLGIFLNGAELVAVERNILRLGFDAADRFPMSQVEKNRATIEGACSDRWKVSARIECVVSGEAPAPAAARRPQQDPAVKSVLDTFDGELV